MKDNANFELPTASEKLPYKFIMDAMKERLAKRSQHPDSPEMPQETVAAEAPVPAPTEPEVNLAQEEACGTQAEPVATPGQQIEIPDLGLSPEAVLGEAPTDTVAMPELNLPQDKKYFRIGEVSEIVGVEPYVLRYWENEFSTVRPVKSKSGQRVYARKDVESLYYIRHLLHVEKFSIKGAKKKLLEMRREAAKPSPVSQKHNLNLKQMISDLKELIHLVKMDPGE